MESTPEGRHLLRRIAIQSDDPDFNYGLAGQLAAMAEFWNGFKHIDPDLPGTLRELNDLASDLRGFDADALVVLLAGHGISGGSGSHFLMLPGSDLGDLGRTAYETDTLVKAMLAAPAPHILIVVNSCFAGALDEVVAEFRKNLRLAHTVGLLVTADHDERPRVLDLAKLLQGVDHGLRTNAQYSEPYLSFNEFLRRLTEAAGDAGVPIPLLLLPATDRDQASLCLPNPGYKPTAHLVTPALQQIALTGSDVDFWRGKASGRPTSDDRGWYFRGRADLLRKVAGHLNGGSGVLVVTGAQSTGKSAILAQAVTLTDAAFSADPRYADMLSEVPDDLKPGAGTVAVAGRAGGKDAATLVRQLVIGLGQAPVTGAGGQETIALVTQLAEQLAAHGAAVAIDGVDESLDPVRLVRDLIAPLSRYGCRMLLGVRSPRPSTSDSHPATLLSQIESLGGTTPLEVIRTDGPGITADIESYVLALLGRDNSPYQSEPHLCADLARVIADAVTPSFLDAQLAAQQLLRAPRRQDPADDLWLSTLHEGTVGLLREDLAAEAAGAHSRQLLAILRAAAFAQGNGIPWAPIWPRVAVAVLGQDIPDADELIERVLIGRLSGYLTRDSEDGQVVYRPNHEKLRDILIHAPHLLLRPRQAP